MRESTTRVSSALQKGQCTAYAAFFPAWYTGYRAQSCSTCPRTRVTAASTSPAALIAPTMSQIQPAIYTHVLEARLRAIHERFHPRP
jgi:hypothetical protein